MDVSSPLKGVKALEEWLTSLGAHVHPSVQHGVVKGGLRGLVVDDTWTFSLQNGDKVCDIPQKCVLRADMTDEDWDAALALSLLQSRSGYRQLLAQETKSPYPPTAPHALRHWTTEQREGLQQSTAGQRLLQLDEEQQANWQRKHQRLVESVDVSWDNFCWAMETVHSRAFQGVDTGSNLVSVAAPIGSAMTGIVYVKTQIDPNNLVLVALAVAATVPTLYKMLRAQVSTAVLLPWIDSANHDDVADSKIVFDPLKQCFQLYIGERCLQSAQDEPSQLVISYGSKSDAELLLNYGFLTRVPYNEDSDAYRRALANAFCASDP